MCLYNDTNISEKKLRRTTLVTCRDLRWVMLSIDRGMSLILLKLTSRFVNFCRPPEYSVAKGPRLILERVQGLRFV